MDPGIIRGLAPHFEFRQARTLRVLAAPELPDVADIFADEKARAAPAPRPPPAPDDAYDWIPVEED